MKKTFFVVLLAVMALVLVNGVSNAAITGTCGNCHTMHNSQDGTNVTLENDGVTLTSTPRDYLLIGGCVYCHVESGAGKTAAGGGWNVADDNSFPSGYFNTADGTAHVTQEVSTALGSVESFYTTITPGGATAPVAGSDELTCAGTTGCHMRTPGTYHHMATGAPFRFLSGVTGLEAELSQATFEVTGNHNVYRSDEMNTFCATCHMDFHGTANTGTGPFVRHPTDNNVTDDGVTDVVDDAMLQNNPWGFTDTTGLSISVAYDETGGKVMCVSCHRAHGSANLDNLRFDYAAQSAGTAGSGCQGCHNK